MNRIFLLTGFLLCFLISMVLQPAYADHCCEEPCPCEACVGFIVSCDNNCKQCSEKQEPLTIAHFNKTIENHRIWMIDFFWGDRIAGNEAGLLAAMMLMTEQLTANAIQKVEIIGTFFDAKHQLETQRLFQTLTARAHKDYHPSEELCLVATASRSLAASERKSTLVATAFSKRAVDRQLLSKDTLEAADKTPDGVTGGGVDTDQRSRLVQFIKTYCNPEDNSRNLNLLCKKGGAAPHQKNKDINYTATLDQPLTLEIDIGDPAVSSDEEAIFALTNNLISHETMPSVAKAALMSYEEGIPGYKSSAVSYLNSRALVAKRSVAANSLASIASLKAAGDPAVEPFIYAIIEELDPSKFSLQNIEALIGNNPSYHAQMEVLTKILYQNPKFYAELYDKPTNVLRKDVAIQAAELMQKRDIFRSLLRSEAVLATILETALIEEQTKITSDLKKNKEDGNDD